MHSLVLKLVASPFLIQAASLAARRWGQAVGGWLVGLPLTSGPIAFFLALDQGTAFAANAAAGSLAGTAAQCGFCLAYAAIARRRSWPWSLAAGTLAFAAGAALLDVAALSLAALLPVVSLTLAGALRLMPRTAGAVERAIHWPRWDIPARMAAASLLVLALTSIAPLLGARLSGICATFPVFAAILAIFAHRRGGGAAAARTLRGLVLGLAGFAGFFFVLGWSLERAGIAAAFAGATLVAIAIQGGTLWLIRRTTAPEPASAR